MLTRLERVGERPCRWGGWWGFAEGLGGQVGGEVGREEDELALVFGRWKRMNWGW